ncbi:hypothetical protein OROMI_023223 [Orobanche minor]
MENDGRRREKRNLLALTGTAALLTVAVNFAVIAISSRLKNRKRKEVPGLNVRINLSASEILKLAEHIIAKSKKVHDAVASVPLDKVSYVNTLLPLAELEAQQFPLIQSCAFPKLVSAVEDIRKASIESERRIDAHVSTCSVFKREFENTVYATLWWNKNATVIKSAIENTDNTMSRGRHMETVQEFERNGLNLTSTKREELQRLRGQIDELSMRYIHNLNDDSTFLLFHDTELVGLPPKYLKNLDKAENGKYKVVLRSHHVTPILELCKVGLTRKSVAVAYGRRCEVNLSVLEKLVGSTLTVLELGLFSGVVPPLDQIAGLLLIMWVQLRHKLARLLGYSNYAEYATDRRMVNSSKKVFEFLENLSVNLTESATKEISLLKELKRKEEGEFPFGVEDLSYYVKRIKEMQFDLDFEVVKQYFPVGLVLSGIFKICQDLFGLRFEEVVVDSEVWHQDVQLFSIFNLSSGELMGYCYLDMEIWPYLFCGSSKWFVY